MMVPNKNHENMKSFCSQQKFQNKCEECFKSCTTGFSSPEAWLFSMKMPEAESQDGWIRIGYWNSPGQKHRIVQKGNPVWEMFLFLLRYQYKPQHLQIQCFNSLHVGSQPAPFWSSSLAQPQWISLIQNEF